MTVRCVLPLIIANAVSGVSHVDAASIRRHNHHVKSHSIVGGDADSNVDAIDGTNYNRGHRRLSDQSIVGIVPPLPSYANGELATAAAALAEDVSSSVNDSIDSPDGQHHPQHYLRQETYQKQQQRRANEENNDTRHQHQHEVQQQKQQRNTQAGTCHKNAFYHTSMTLVRLFERRFLMAYNSTKKYCHEYHN